MSAAAPKQKIFKGTVKDDDVRSSNMVASKAVADAVRTSLGPRGMDKMIVTHEGEVLITNDGATILDQIDLTHPAAKMMVQVAKAQDVEAGDGTTSVTVLAGSLLNQCHSLLEKGIHPMNISDGFGKAHLKAAEVLRSMAVPVDLKDRDTLIKCASTSLNSKVVSQYASLLAPIAVDASMAIMQEGVANIDLDKIQVVKRLGGTIDDTKLVNGICFPQGASKKAGGPTNMLDAKIALIQFCLSAPKADMDSQILVREASQIDRILREERKYLLKLVKAIKKAGINVLLVQKSILRDALSNQALHYLAKAGILVVRDVDRKDVEFISQALGVVPIADVSSITQEKLGAAKRVEEVNGVVEITGCVSNSGVSSILCRAGNTLVLEEVDRSIHDALCVIRSIVKEPFLIAGGGASEIAISLQLGRWAETLTGKDAYVVRGFAEAFGIIPFTLAENAGLNAVNIVTKLRASHVAGNHSEGINVRKGAVSNMIEEDVVQPLLVSLSAVTLASEHAQAVLKIDDVVAC